MSCSRGKLSSLTLCSPGGCQMITGEEVWWAELGWGQPQGPASWRSGNIPQHPSLEWKVRGDESCQDCWKNAGMDKDVYLGHRARINCLYTCLGVMERSWKSFLPQEG